MWRLVTTVLQFFLTAFISLVAIAYLYSFRVFKYFEKRGMPFEPASFPLGSLGPIFAFKKSYNEMLWHMYRKHKGKKCVGFFQFFNKSVLVIDRELVRQVLVKDYEYFDGKGIHHNKDLEPLSAHLFALDGYEWKLLRMKMSPVFTSGKLKGMFNTISEVGQELVKYVDRLTAENEVQECKDIFVRYGLAMIANTAFGLESDVLNDKSSMFLTMAEAVTAPTLDAMYRLGLMFYGGDIAKKFNLRIIRTDVHDFFLKLIKDVVGYRETHGKTRNDFLQLLMQLKQGANVEGQDFSITMNELAAQSFVFILAGYETTSNTMSYFLYEMALNPEVQRKVHAEVDAVDEINFESLASMEYLEMSIDEALRKNSPLGFLSRMCSKDYRVPDTNHVIEKGTQVLVSAHGLHWDPDLFPNPEQFIPERFSKENKSNIKPFSYMPFSEGPRFCIGMRFGKLTIKAGLALLLRQYEVQTTPNTPVPFRYDPRCINSTAAGGIWLRLVRRSPQTS